MTSTPGTSGGRRTRKKLATRRAIRRTALDLFTAHGFDAVTVEQITEAADVAPMTFYRHFGTKQALVMDIAFTDQIARTLDRALTPPGPGQPPDIDRALDDLLTDADQWLDDLARRDLIDSCIVQHMNPRHASPASFRACSCKRKSVFIASIGVIVITSSVRSSASVPSAKSDVIPSPGCAICADEAAFSCDRSAESSGVPAAFCSSVRRISSARAVTFGGSPARRATWIP